MYAQTQYYRHRYISWLQWVFATIALVQVLALLANETGWAAWALAPVVHVLVLLTVGCSWLILTNGHLSLSVSPKGWDLRYFPFQIYPRHIAWDEVRQIQLTPSNVWRVKEHQYSFPKRQYIQSFQLGQLQEDVIRLDLRNGEQIFVFSKQSRELYDFLQKSLLQARQI